MASSGVQVLRELSLAFLQCEICTGNFKEPRDLDCKHTYCLQCLTFLFEDQPRGTNSITCPSCQKPTAITDGGIRALSRNPILESLLEKITTHTEKLLRNSCSKHEGRDLALFCRKCDIAICHVCALESHPKPEHEFVPLSTVVKNHRELCNEHMRDIADEIVHDERNLKTARRKSAILREKKDEVESEIHQAAEDVMQLIKIREQELGEELDCVLETREEELHVFCKALEKKLIDNRKMMDELRSILERGEDTEIVNKYCEIRKKKVHKVPQAPDGLRFVSFKRDEEKITKDNLGCLMEMMIPWNDNHIVEVANGHDANQKEVKGKKEKSEKDTSEKAQSKHEKTQSKNDKEGIKRGDSGKKQHPSQLPPTPPASPPRSLGVFSIGPTPFVKVQPISQGGGGGGGGCGSSTQTLSSSSDIFGNTHQQRSHKESLRKGIRIVDPNSNQDITELIMGDKNRNQKVKKRGSQKQQQQQQERQSPTEG